MNESDVPVGSCLICGHHAPFVVFTNGNDDPLTPRWVGCCERCRASAISAALAPPVGRPSIPQQDLPEAAATVLRENLWSLITEDVQPRVGPLTARIDGQELPQSGHEAKSPLPSGRNEWRLDDQGCLDDVVVDDVVTFCLERMNDDHIWGSVYHRDGSQTHFNFFGERLSLTHEHEE
jgi:hypothetical protein